MFSLSTAIGNEDFLRQSPETIQSLENAARYASHVTRASRATLMMQRGAASDPPSRGAASDPMYGGAASNSSAVGATSNPSSRGPASDPPSREAASYSLYGGAASDASAVGAASNPTSRGAASIPHPPSKGAAWYSLSRGAASDPPSREAASNPLSRGAASDPLSRIAAVNPLARGAALYPPSGSHDGATASRAMFAGSGAGTSSAPALSAVPTVMPSSSQLSDSTREMSVQSDAAVVSDDSEDSYVTTSSSDASLRSDTDTSSSYVVASSDSHDSVYPRCTVQTRPALGHIATMSDAARTRHRMVLPPVLGECTPSATIESHFSPAHRSRSSDDDEAAFPPDGAPTTSEGHRRTAASGSSGRAITFSGLHSRSTEPRAPGGSTSVGRTSTGTSGGGSYLEVGSMQTRPRLVGAPRTTASVGSSEERPRLVGAPRTTASVGSSEERPRLVGAPRTTASVGSSEERRLGTSAAPQSQSQVRVYYLN